MGGFALAMLSIAVTVGLLAQQKLKGAKDVDAPGSRKQLSSRGYNLSLDFAECMVLRGK